MSIVWFWFSLRVQYHGGMAQASGANSQRGGVRSTIRQPLEEVRVTISRAAGTMSFRPLFLTCRAVTTPIDRSCFRHHCPNIGVRDLAGYPARRVRVLASFRIPALVVQVLSS